MLIIEILYSILYLLFYLVLILLVIALAIPFALLFLVYWILFRSWRRNNRDKDGKKFNGPDIQKIVDKAVQRKTERIESTKARDGNNHPAEGSNE